MQKEPYLMDANIVDDQFGIAEACDALGMNRAKVFFSETFRTYSETNRKIYFRTSS